MDETLTESDFREILEKEIAKTREELPFSLKVKEIAELTRINENTMYQKIKEIPGANKLVGEWRVPRDMFIPWFYTIFKGGDNSAPNFNPQNYKK